MKFFTPLALFAGLAAAAPTAIEAEANIEARQFGSTGDTANELTGLFSRCREYTFIFARGSTERGNLGTLGGPMCDGLKRAYGSTNVACQGVGGDYRASLAGNSFPEGTTPSAYNEAISLFEQAREDCPNTIIVAGGYSQGAAVMTAAVRRLDDDVQSALAGVVLFGSTRNAQENGVIPNYPSGNTRTYCNRTDGVCGGRLQVTAGHLTYSSDVPAAVRFLQDRVSAL